MIEKSEDIHTKSIKPTPEEFHNASTLMYWPIT